MTECSQSSFSFARHFSCEVVARFDGGRITSDAGAVLSRPLEQRTGILRQFAACFRDDRNPERIEHSVSELVRQRVYGLARGYALSNWTNRTALCRYVEDGDLEIDNNAAERSMRGVAVGGKNWLFYGSDAGDRTAAVLTSFMASCRQGNIDPFAYLKDVLGVSPRTRSIRWSSCCRRTENRPALKQPPNSPTRCPHGLTGRVRCSRRCCRGAISSFAREQPVERYSSGIDAGRRPAFPKVRIAPASPCFPISGNPGEP